MGPAGRGPASVWCDEAMLGPTGRKWYGLAPLTDPARVVPWHDRIRGSLATGRTGRVVTRVAAAGAGDSAGFRERRVGRDPGRYGPLVRERGGEGTGRRADIQGLRAVAVVVVVAFHAGLPFIPGGFVGVDVFFVISGFVITAMLAREWQRDGTVHLGRFWMRRVRRLTPALALVVAVTMVMASLLLSPFDQQEVAARTALGALALCANWVISVVTASYFAPSAEDNPLLHTWSLSVEEQFYLVFPLLLLLGWRLGRRFGRPRVVAIAVTSALGLASLAMLRGASLGVPADSWLLGFYSPLNRAWEFAAGAVLALVAHRLRAPRVVATVLGVVGAAGLVASLVVITGETPFPGKMTVLPVGATALLLAAGSVDAGNPVSRALAVRPMVAVGDWSYSWYLWHWPLLVVATTVWPLSPVAAPVAAFASLLPAVASYRFVEEPFRTHGPREPRALARAVAVVVAVPLVLAGATWVAADRLWQPAFRDGGVAAAYPLSPAEVPGSVLPESPGNPCTTAALEAAIAGNGLCRQSAPSAGITVALLGDSHAEHLFPGLAEALPDENVGVYSFRAPMMFGSAQRLDVALDELVAIPSLRTVVVSREWRRDGLSPTDELAPLRTVVERLTAAGRTVLVTDDVPSYPFPVFACRYRVSPVLPWSLCSRSAEDVEAEREAYVRDITTALGGNPRASLLPVSASFCDATTCSMAPHGRVLYVDGNHLNTEGSRFVAERLVRAGPLQTALAG